MNKNSKKHTNYILEQTRKKGRHGDTMLAHINPFEAMLLKKQVVAGQSTLIQDYLNFSLEV